MKLNVKNPLEMNDLKHLEDFLRMDYVNGGFCVGGLTHINVFVFHNHHLIFVAPFLHQMI